MYEASSFKVVPTIPYSVRYAVNNGAKLQKQAAGPLGRFVGKTLLSPFWLTGKLGSGIWNKGTRLLSPRLSIHPKRLGWLGRTFGGRQKVRRNAEAVELARAARAFSQPQRDRTFLQMRRQLANATGDRRAILEANMPNFDPATGLNRGKYFMQRGPDGRMHAKKTRVQGMNEFTDFLNRGTVPQGARATSTAQQAANTAQNASRAQQAAQQTAQQATQQAAQQTAQQATQAAEQAANTAAQQAPRAARPRPMRRSSNQSMSAAQWARTRQGQQDLARRQARNSAARRAQQTTQQAARTNDLNFRQPVDNGSFGPSFRQPVNNGGFGANFRQPVGQGNYSINAQNAFNTLAGRTNTARRTYRYVMPSQAIQRAAPIAATRPAAEKELDRSARDYATLKRRILTSDNPSAVLTEFPSVVQGLAPRQKAAFYLLANAVNKQKALRDAQPRPSLSQRQFDATPLGEGRIIEKRLANDAQYAELRRAMANHLRAMEQ